MSPSKEPPWTIRTCCAIKKYKYQIPTRYYMMHCILYCIVLQFPLNIQARAATKTQTESTFRFLLPRRRQFTAAAFPCQIRTTTQPRRGNWTRRWTSCKPSKEVGLICLSQGLQICCPQVVKMLPDGYNKYVICYSNN